LNRISASFLRYFKHFYFCPVVNQWLTENTPSDGAVLGLRVAGARIGVSAFLLNPTLGPRLVKPVKPQVKPGSNLKFWSGRLVTAFLQATCRRLSESTYEEQKSVMAEEL
jgi:hypothetical protein